MDVLRDTLTKKLKLLASVPKLAWSDPVEYYEYLGADVVEGESDQSNRTNDPLRLNLAFWESARMEPFGITDYIIVSAPKPEWPRA